MKNHRYNLVHALVATVALLVMLFGRGLGSFWNQFVHGGGRITPENAVQMATMSSALFGSLLLVLWISTLFLKKPEPVEEAPRSRWRTIGLVLLSTPVIVIGAMVLSAIGALITSAFTGEASESQELVKVLLQDSISNRNIFVLGGFAVICAPLLEEMLFRGVIFRGFMKSMPPWAAMLLSGAIFSLAHVNAATFGAIWFLGCAFAWLYRRTGTILASMFVHSAFNTFNLLLLLLARYMLKTYNLSM